MKKQWIICLGAAAALALSGCQSTGQSVGTESHTTEAVSVQETETEIETETEAAEQETGETISIKLGIPKAPPSLPVLRMMEEEMLGTDVELELDIWDSPEQLIAMVQGGEHQMFAFPLTVAAKLYNKGVGIRLTNVNTWGVTYFVTTDPEFTDWAQLKGQTVYVPLQSSPPDALTQFFLNEAGLKPGEDLEIVYSTTSEISQLLAAEKIRYATLIEPQVTAAISNNEHVRVAFSFEEEWQRVRQDETAVPNAGFGATQTFCEENEELMTRFEEAYEEALNWVLENPKEAGVLAEKYLGLKAGLVENAVPRMGLMYKPAAEAKPELDEFYQLLNEFDQSMIGGTIPDEGMYYQK